VLAARTARLDAATRSARATTRLLEQTRSERSAYVSELRRRLELGRQELARLESAVDDARARTRLLAGGSTAAPAVSVARSGSRTISVTAIAYTLPGTTATGLPVGRGVVAVDPSVIPLGTRLSVPGYGDAVAADTGGAIVGNTIDVWFPTAAEAAAWGRRSITVTIR
jgi:3D (Asp-Asp-Asp) domain-containing protein